MEEVAFATVQETDVVDKGNVRKETEKTAKFSEQIKFCYLWIEKRRGWGC